MHRQLVCRKLGLDCNKQRRNDVEKKPVSEQAYRRLLIRQMGIMSMYCMISSRAIACSSLKPLTTFAGDVTSAAKLFVLAC